MRSDPIHQPDMPSHDQAEASQSIAFIGLGALGAPIARHLVNAGHRVTAYNRTAAKAEKWLASAKAAGDGTVGIADSPRNAAQGADVVITCVGNDADLADVLLGPNGAMASAADGALFIDHTTVSARISRQMATECSDRGMAFVDAPVSGGQAGAEQGTLAVMCGGTEHAIKRARPVMEVYSSRIVHVGGAGAGQVTKMVNQIAIAGLMGALSEAVRFAQETRLDLDRVFEAISGGAAQSWQMDNRWATMVKDEFDFGFAIDWMRKDLGYALDEARQLGVALPVTALIDQFYGEVQAIGGSRQDTSALVRRYPQGRA